MAKTIRIGHASTDSASSSANEVLISTYYSSLNPTVVLRPITSTLAEKSAAACEAGCNNNSIEYSQAYRNTLNTEAKKVNYNLSSITTKCYADCSSFMTVCAIAGGARVSYEGGAPNCGNMRSRFTRSRDYTALTDAVYLNSSDYLRRGDILVRENYQDGSRHTVMILDNGSKVSTSVSDDIVTIDVEASVDIVKTAYTAVNVALDITNITASKAVARAKLTRIKDGKEKDLSNLAIKTYNWSYRLETLSTKKIKTSDLAVSSATQAFSLTGLKPDTSYRLTVLASEEDSDVEFSSPSVIFMTPPKSSVNDLKIEFKDTSLYGKKCHLFVRVKETFKRAILYNKEV